MNSTRFQAFSDKTLGVAEMRFGRFGAALIFGFFLLVAAAFLTTPRWGLYYHGRGFANLSMAPFDFTQESGLRYRILTPLVGYLLFLKGPLLKYLMLFVLGLFFTVVYYFQRGKNYAPTESFGITALLSFSTLSFYQYHFPGYNDPFSFLLMGILLFTYRNRLWAGILLSLLLFNHDNTVFVMPFFFLLMTEGDRSLSGLWRTARVFIAAILPYVAYRFYISAHAPVDFDTGYYFDKGNLFWTYDHVSEYLGQGIFQAFKLSWIFPLLALVIDWKEKRFREIVLLLVLFVGVTAQMIIAYDISRLMGWAFPAILMGAWRVRDYSGEKKFNRLLWLVILLNCFIPSYCIGALEPIPYPPFWLSKLCALAFA